MGSPSIHLRQHSDKSRELPLTCTFQQRIILVCDIVHFSPQLSDFLPVLKLYDLLYPEREPLPVPDVNDPLSCHQMAPVCIWIHLMKKAQLEGVSVHRPLPIALKTHHE